MDDEDVKIDKQQQRWTNKRSMDDKGDKLTTNNGDLQIYDPWTMKMIS